MYSSPVKAHYFGSCLRFRFSGSQPRRFIMFPKNGGVGCARTGRVGQAHIKSDCALAQTALYCASAAARIRRKERLKVIKSIDALCEVSEAAEQTKNFLSFCFSPFGGGVRGEPQKNARKFLGLPRGTPRAEALPAQSGRTLRVQATTRSARAKWVRAKANISPQIETSESERSRAEGAAEEWAGRKCRREAANWNGAGAEKWGDLALVSNPKTI